MEMTVMMIRIMVVTYVCVCVTDRDDADAVDKISELVGRMHSIVIGPGLGRDKHLLAVVKVSNVYII